MNNTNFNIDFEGGKESTTQRQAILPVWRNEDCNQAYFQPITENFICAGYADGGVDACQVRKGAKSIVLGSTIIMIVLGRFWWTFDVNERYSMGSNWNCIIW